MCKYGKKKSLTEKERLETQKEKGMDEGVRSPGREVTHATLHHSTGEGCGKQIKVKRRAWTTNSKVPFQIRPCVVTAAALIVFLRWRKDIA